MGSESESVVSARRLALPQVSLAAANYLADRPLHHPTPRPHVERGIIKRTWCICILPDRRTGRPLRAPVRSVNNLGIFSYLGGLNGGQAQVLFAFICPPSPHVRLAERRGYAPTGS